MNEPATPSSRPTPRKILLVRPSALGDVSRTVPVLVSLKAAYPDADIDWFVNEHFVDVIKAHPALHEAIPYPRTRLAGFGLRKEPTRLGRALARTLRQARYDLVYDVQGLARSGFAAWLTRAPRRVGFRNAREMGWLGYNVRHEVSAEQHTVDRMLGLIEADGISVSRDLQLYLAPDDRGWLADWQRENGTEPGGYICLAPTARWGCKCWPIDRYARLAVDLLQQRPDDRLVILAAPSERKQIAPLTDAMQALPEAEQKRVLIPETTVGQLMAILSETSLLVCNDSAPLHIAVGFDRSIVTVFGPTDPARVGPYQRDDCVLRPQDIAQTDLTRYRKHLDDNSLIARVPYEEVWGKVVATLEEPA